MDATAVVVDDLFQRSEASVVHIMCEVRAIFRSDDALNLPSFVGVNGALEGTFRVPQPLVGVEQIKAVVE